MSELKELPAGWRWVCIGELCEFQYGKSLPELNRVPGYVKRLLELLSYANCY